MFHCGTKPVLAHIANGMYGAIIVEPRKPLPPADKNYVLVASEWYLSSPGFPKPAGSAMAKAQRQEPDWVSWNGYAGQYVTHPLTADPGDTVRFWVVDAGPSFDTAFHVVGTILNRAWVNADMTQFQRNVQTAVVPAGGGGVFDVKIDAAGPLPVRQPLLRERRPRPGRSSERRQRQGDDVPLAFERRTDRYACSPPERRVPAVQTLVVQCSKLGVMKKRLLISGIVLAALLLALYGVILGANAR